MVQIPLMQYTKEQFLAKYPKPQKCLIPIEEWCTPLGYCWAYASAVDKGEKWNEDEHCPCEGL